ncbi:MAG: 50S ribosomal protein L3 [Candidatus Yanofskybacteria bacterium RIFOXYD1_FULL_44_17]|nr:MAG: 50S ribosomal protein L3 [Candidatus Yanofskybacteria bacterium RIFOXYA1_FULL_44_17]OGN36679.1 MAG: 50S ribosomal protein L3 [Candidatus Yanofskybacteria bacterium RIFOXYA2_FULL_45_28]OGN37222.1 MAG: 50S ribosomal protein L3 [Candidatus Yanofskybacteria bacterium RIFOXYC1_FULL_44_16]OGN38257.1 MAG: 50S ribosomal protein L3 [Candidatus Yanofskybacteria bacterium RIFOXYB1_FULL_44_29]OGN39043.1 MAG: 50S ribosomal protein L3 [Candidatus Yanofskybacteria bacterium RIFOXYB2_FULL_44_18]OGN400
MMKFIIGKKLGMSQFFREDGAVVPMTVVEVTPNVVVQVKTVENDGYEAVQLGFGSKKNNTKALKKHFKDLGSFALLKEFKGSKFADKDLAVGDKIDASLFEIGDKVKVTGLAKGKGFAGAVKRHGFHGMPASHGHRSVQRHVGSIGQRFPQHTLKGLRMAGRMGGGKSTARGLQIVHIDQENNLICIKGALPGNIGGVLEIISSK